MKSKRVKILAVAVVLFIIVSPVMAAIHFRDGGVHDIDYEINDDIRVDYTLPGKGTTVNILEGGRIIQNNDMEVFGDSIINVLGGSIDSRLWAYDNSQVTVSGGSINSYFFAHSTVIISGGSLKSLLARGSSQVTISGGSINRLKAYSNGQVVFSGGAIRYELHAWDDSGVTVSGGSIGGDLRVSENAVVTMDGWDFAVDGEPVGYIELMSTLGTAYNREPYRRLTGTLASGEPINNDFQIGDNAKIVLVPEPATLLLLGFGGLLLRRKKQ